MIKHTLHNGQSVMVSADQWDGSSVICRHQRRRRPDATVTLTGPNTLTSLMDIGSAAPRIWRDQPDARRRTDNRRLDHQRGHLVGQRTPGSSVSFNGTSRSSTRAR